MIPPGAAPDTPQELRWPIHLAVFLAALAIVVLRRPDALLHPQFWAEDGAVWYASAYNFGAIHTLFWPLNGYFQTAARLTAAVAQLFPMTWAPAIFNLVAITAQILPVNFLLSSRFAPILPSLKTRVLLAFIYLALPNSWEVHANLTNLHWHLALLAFMVIVAAPSRHLAWRVYDVAVVLLSGLSGPFSVMLIPLAARWWWTHRGPWPLLILTLISCCGLIQAAGILVTAPQTRVLASLGPTPALFLRILSGQVFLGALIGQQGYAHLVSPSGWYTALAFVITAMGLFAVSTALLKGPEALRLFIVFAALIFAAALITPFVRAPLPRWEVSAWPGVNGRYWFIPMLAFVTALLWMTGKTRPRGLRAFASLALALMMVGLILDWRQPAFQDFHFNRCVREFNAAPDGAEVIFPLNPPGWYMLLIKGGV